MKTFYLFCQLVYGEVPPQFTPEEQLLLAGCEKTYATQVLCEEAKVSAMKVKHPEVHIITSCGLKE